MAFRFNETPLEARDYGSVTSLVIGVRVFWYRLRDY